jgi:2-dehydro-3-deoxyglucarate aldolase/4-hydroxy-2-oxoheptanedioate aldolase
MASSIIPQNRLKRLLREGKSAIGTMVVEVRQASIMQVLSNAGLDFVIIDNEHGAFNIETISHLSRAARQVGVTPIVRVPEWSYAHVTQPLDSGAQAIMAPRITDPGQVRELVQMMKYPPIGRRGSVVARGHTDLKAGSIVDVMNDANEESMLIVQIETKQALEGIDAILAVPGVDVALVGPTDLSVALGIPGKMTDPTLVAAITSVIEACGRSNIHPAIHMNDLTLASHWASKGMKLVSFNSEVGMLTQAATSALASIAAAVGR